MDFNEIGSEGVDWIHLAQELWLAHLSSIINPRVLLIVMNYLLPKNDSAVWKWLVGNICLSHMSRYKKLM